MLSFPFIKWLSPTHSSFKALTRIFPHKLWHQPFLLELRVLLILCKQPLCVPSLYPWPAVCVPRVVSCTHPVLQPFIQSDATNLSSSYSFYWGFPHGCMTIMLQVDFVGGNGIILEVFPVLMVMMCSKMPGEPETSSLPICFYPTCALYHQFVNHMWLLSGWKSGNNLNLKLPHGLMTFLPPKFNPHM